MIFYCRRAPAVSAGARACLDLGDHLLRAHKVAHALSERQDPSLDDRLRTQLRDFHLDRSRAQAAPQKERGRSQRRQRGAQQRRRPRRTRHEPWEDGGGGGAEGPRHVGQETG